jgi:glycosyltransferase involved in cell wall biosynthesis
LNAAAIGRRISAALLSPPPLVTVVTPSFNHAGFIRATIESVLSQDYPHLEYIVMDGGSTDGTDAIVREYASRLSWISERDRGQSHAINKGFTRARGDVVAWLNSDDMFLPGAVTRAIDAFRAAPTAGAVYGEGYLIDRAGHRIGRFPETRPLNLWRLVYLSDFVLQQSTFFRRAAVEDVGWLDEDLHYAMDWDLLIKLGKRFGLQYVPEYLGLFRIYDEAKTSSGGRRRISEIRRVLERHTGLKRAPGFWVYGLDTLQQSVRRALVDRRRPVFRFPGRMVNLAVYVPTAAAIMLILRHAQGLYPDGWASDRLKWMLPAGAGDVIVRGLLPDSSDRTVTMSVVIGRRTVGTWDVAAGEFELRFAAPDVSSALSFEIHASRYRRSAWRQLSLRRVSFFLKSVDRASTTMSQ